MARRSGIDHLEFRSPAVTYQRRDGSKVDLYFSDVWQRRLKTMWDFLTQLQGMDIGPSQENPPLTEPDGGGSILRLLDQAPALPGHFVDDLRLALEAPPPQRPNFTIIIRDTAANLGNYPAAGFPDGYYLETDTFVTRYSDGTNWVEILAPALLKFLGSTSSFPALKRATSILQVRLADDSAYSDLEVLDEAYDVSAWNGSVEVPTKNAIRDKINALFPLDPPGGTYTPALTNVANAPTLTAYECQYLRVGNMVTVSGKLDVDPTLAISTQIGIALPIASNLGATEDCSGVAFCPAVAGQGAAILADVANDRAQMEWVAIDLSARSMHFIFFYQVI